MPLTQSEKEEADELLVSLKYGDSSEREQARIALEAWSRNGAEHSAYLCEHKSAEALLDTLAPALRQRYTRRIESVAAEVVFVRSIRRPALYVPLVFASVVVVACALWVGNPVFSQQTGVSAVGEQVTLTLDDGSEALLNTNSSVRFERRLRSRDVVIERGEVLFSVVHNAWRPFHVRVGRTEIKDIGTRFSVRLLDDGVTVAVLEGRVAVTPTEDVSPLILTANEAMWTDGSQVESRPDVGALVAWKDQRLDFDDTPLTEVVVELRRYRSAPIVLADPRAGRARISGGFSSADPDRLLKTLPAVAPVTVSFKMDGTAVIASR
jgi:transmembrane sensor